MIPCLPIMCALQVDLAGESSARPAGPGLCFFWSYTSFGAPTAASFLLTGPLVDRVLTPAAGTAAWQRVAPLLGTGPAAAIGLVQVVTGLVLLAGAVLDVQPSLGQAPGSCVPPDYQAEIVGRLSHMIYRMLRVQNSAICRIVES